jgi:hypothetical protein
MAEFVTFGMEAARVQRIAHFERPASGGQCAAS